MNVLDISPVKVGGFNYALRYDTIGLARRGNVAELEHTSNEILLSEDYGPQPRLQSVIHEAMHAIIQLYYGGLSDPVLEEGIVTQLSQGWYQVMRDNPRLLQAFIELNEEQNETK